MSELISSKGQPVVGRNLCFLCRHVAERLQEEGSHEPYESRGSRTDLWGTGGEIPPVYPAEIQKIDLQFFLSMSCIPPSPPLSNLS